MVRFSFHTVNQDNISASPSQPCNWVRLLVLALAEACKGSENGFLCRSCFLSYVPFRAASIINSKKLPSISFKHRHTEQKLEAIESGQPNKKIGKKLASSDTASTLDVNLPTRTNAQNGKEKPNCHLQRLKDKGIGLLRDGLRESLELLGRNVRSDWGNAADEKYTSKKSHQYSLNLR